MVLLIIIPFLNGYFIGNIPYFQTNPCCEYDMVLYMMLYVMIYDVMAYVIMFFFALSLHIPRKDGFAQYSAFKSQNPFF